MSAPAGWNEETTASWVDNLATREAELAPVADALFAAAELRPGETVLDVGCGPGGTTRRAAAAVGPAGRATGTDVSPGMLAAARAGGADAAVDWLLGDATDADFGTDAYDVVLSRFGVMFFLDPVTAFANLARSCRPTGRLVLAVWRGPEHAEIFGLARGVVADLLSARGLTVPPLPAGPGPMSLGDRTATTTLLERSGWTGVHFDAPDATLRIAENASVEKAVSRAIDGGPAGRLLEDQPESVVAEARAALTAVYERRWDGTGIPVQAGFWVVSARPR